MGWCPTCGSEVAERWRFCRSCGAPLAEDAAPQTGTAVTAVLESATSSDVDTRPGAAVLDVSHDKDLPGEPRRRWLRITAVVVGILLLVGGVTAGGWMYFDTRRELRVTAEALERTQRELTAAAEALEDTRSQLATVRDEKEALRREYQDLRLELRGVRGSLSEAQHRLELQAGQIADLKACLNGVSLALDNVLSGDYWAAASALTAVESSCQVAFSLF